MVFRAMLACMTSNTFAATAKDSNSLSEEVSEMVLCMTYVGCCAWIPGSSLTAESFCWARPHGANKVAPAQTDHARTCLTVSVTHVV